MADHDIQNNRSDDELTRVPVSSGDDAGLESPFEDDDLLDDDCMFIECPGATIYEPGTRNVICGVRFFDDNDPAKGYEIIDKPVYAPEHVRRRIIKKEHAGSIRRCQACQDLTVRMMRREGPDMCIPSSRFPRRQRLKSVEKTW